MDLVALDGLSVVWSSQHGHGGPANMRNILFELSADNKLDAHIPPSQFCVSLFLESLVPHVTYSERGGGDWHGWSVKIAALVSFPRGGGIFESAGHIVKCRRFFQSSIFQGLFFRIFLQIAQHIFAVP